MNLEDLPRPNSEALRNTAAEIIAKFAPLTATKCVSESSFMFSASFSLIKPRSPIAKPPTNPALS